MPYRVRTAISSFKVCKHTLHLKQATKRALPPNGCLMIPQQCSTHQVALAAFILLPELLLNCPMNSGQMCPHGSCWPADWMRLTSWRIHQHHVSRSKATMIGFGCYTHICSVVGTAAMPLLLSNLESKESEAYKHFECSQGAASKLPAASL